MPPCTCRSSSARVYDFEDMRHLWLVVPDNLLAGLQQGRCSPLGHGQHHSMLNTTMPEKEVKPVSCKYANQGA